MKCRRLVLLLFTTIACAPTDPPLPTPGEETVAVELKELPAFTYGAVYFRKTNPPPEDWEQDYRTAAEDGHNLFRHWFFWSAIETTPGVYDWSDYDRQLDLAAEHGFTTIIAEMLTSAPEWAFHKWPDARLENRDGTRDPSGINNAGGVGGFPGLSLNHPEVKAAASRFLRAMAERYRDHPALGGYDLANEIKFPQTPRGEQADYDFSPATAEVFRQWLQNKYGDLATLSEAWNRWGFTEWSQVEPPRHVGPFPDVLDWLEFRVINFHDQVRWRADVIREVDPHHAIVGHGKARVLDKMGASCNDPWRAAAICDIYGFTWGAHGKGKDPWKQFHAADLIRAASRGKKFWHAEAIGGPTWTSAKSRDDGKVPTPEDVRLWNMVSLAGGATGIMNPRWRPLLIGPLFGAYGFYGLDGSRTDRSEMASSIAKWGTAPEQAELWQARPIQGEIGIIVVPESQLFAYAQQGGDGSRYSESVWGAYRGFFDNNIQADWVHVDHIDDYDLLYLPYPVMLLPENAAAIATWVENGGTLISEGCPGYHGTGGWVGQVQPNSGLDEVFGVRESYVEFGPNIHQDFVFTIDGLTVPAGVAHQEYEVTTGSAVGTYTDGSIAAVDHGYGTGRTRLIGTHPGWGHFNAPNRNSTAFFSRLLQWAGVDQHAAHDVPGVIARVHRGDGATYLWIVNHDLVEQKVRMTLSEEIGEFDGATVFWGADNPQVDGRTVVIDVGGHDAAVLRLEN